MCRICIDAAKAAFPGFSDEEIGDVLWGATGFPAVPAELVVKQIGELAAAGCKTAKECCGFADSKLVEWEISGPHERSRPPE